jgi:hypothetical protein
MKTGKTIAPVVLAERPFCQLARQFYGNFLAYTEVSNSSIWNNNKKTENDLDFINEFPSRDFSGNESKTDKFYELPEKRLPVFEFSQVSFNRESSQFFTKLAATRAQQRLHDFNNIETFIDMYRQPHKLIVRIIL